MPVTMQTNANNWTGKTIGVAVADDGLSFEMNGESFTLEPDDCEMAEYEGFKILHEGNKLGSVGRFAGEQDWMALDSGGTIAIDHVNRHCAAAQVIANIL